MILLVPFNSIETELLKALEEKLIATFKTKVKLAKPLPLPKALKRKSPFSDSEQLNAEAFLPSIKRAKEKESANYALGITKQDLFVPGLNFVFGRASGNLAVISLYRLKSANKKLFFARAAKEAVHELGHCFGLKHCPDLRCVMHFSNSLADTDYKSENFCEKCKKKLR